MAAKRKKAGKTRYTRLKIYLILGMATLVFASYYLLLRPNVKITTDYCNFYVSENTSFDTVYQILKSKDLLYSYWDLWILTKLVEIGNVPKGLYQLKKQWGNYQLIKALEKGNNKSFISYRIPAHRMRKNIIGDIARQAKVEEKSLMTVLNDSTFLNSYGFNPESVYCIFIPGTYKMYQNSNARQVITNISTEYALFWNEKRRGEAKQVGLLPEDAVKLASIVYAETKDVKEMPVIAGLYLNRLKKNMRLEADPTMIFARGDWKSRRVYFKFRESESPYNTYKYKGLPPGPIGPAPISAIESVLHAHQHNYLFFCAKGDQSGCHLFTENFTEHRLNAVKYRTMLDRKKIK